MNPGFSQTPLVKKLGLKAGMHACILDAPAHYADLLGPLPDNVKLTTILKPELDFIQVFAHDHAALEKHLVATKPNLASAGMLWLCWPKKTASLLTDLDGNLVRGAGLAAGLVDVKICAIDAAWSGLKFVYRLQDR